MERYVPAWRPERTLSQIQEEIGWRQGTVKALACYLVEQALRISGEASNSTEWANSVGYRWNPLGPRPTLPDREITPEEAEHFVQRLVSYLGEPGAKTTRFVDDGGIDVISENYAIQVKHEARNIGPQVVREIFGVASSLGKRAAVFARVGFTRSAIQFAESNNIVLVTYDGPLMGWTAAGREALEKGL